MNPWGGIRPMISSPVAGILRHQRFQEFNNLLIFDICGIGKLLAVFIPHGAEFRAFLDVVQDPGDICDLLRSAAMFGRCAQRLSKHGFIKFLCCGQYVGVIKSLGRVLNTPRRRMVSTFSAMTVSMLYAHSS